MLSVFVGWLGGLMSGLQTPTLPATREALLWVGLVAFAGVIVWLYRDSRAMAQRYHERDVAFTEKLIIALTENTATAIAHTEAMRQIDGSLRDLKDAAEMVLNELPEARKRTMARRRRATGP